MLTAKQQQLLLFIDERLNSGGVSPSFDEMKDALGLKSKSGVHRLINALEERGFIKRMANRARALEVVKLPDGVTTADQPSNVIAGDFGSKPVSENMVEIPLHGRIAAGAPIEAIENADSVVAVPLGMIGRGDCYALEISGDSMVDLGILDGDTVIIESSQTARSGEIVVALVDDMDATLKTLKKDGSSVALIPANQEHETQIYDAGRVSVQGRLVGLFRQYH